MKILHIDTGKKWRGGQRQVLFLHEGLLEAGFQSIIVCSDQGELCKKDVPNIIPVSFTGEADISFISELKNIIKTEKPDVVHTHDAHSLTPALFAKLTGKSFKLINTRRVAFSINKNFISRKKYSNSKVDRVVAISDAIRKTLTKDGVNPAKVPLIYSGVRFPKSINYSKVLELREKYGINEDSYVVGTVGNITEEKDHATMIDAFAKFCITVDEAKLIIVGDGPLMEDLKKKASALPDGSIIFAGYSDEVYEHLALFDVFCMTSKMEGLCTSIIDAFFMGRPVAATNTGGIPELVRHKFNGLLSEVGDVDSLSENLMEIYDDMPMETKFSANAYHTALKFSDGSMVYKYIELYKELISG